MPEDDDPQVSEWQTWRKKVDEALFGKPKSGAEDDPKAAEPKTPEPVQPPKADVKPPPEPTLQEPAPIKARGPLHKMIFG